MPQQKQSFEKHAQWTPIYHFVASPLVAFYAVYKITQFFKAPGSATAWEAAFAIGVMATVWSARIMALTVQNRVIRLEMRLRLREVLNADLAKRIPELTTRQLIALRFASDAELPNLVERTLKGEFPTGKAIKAAVKDWQSDYLRA
jgi:hypothetical protein